MSDNVKGETAVVARIPNCDVCGEAAVYDARTIHGPWAMLCEVDYQELGIGLGIGRGQRLVLAHG